ncbi:MAG: universal stress protein [Candidatus Binatia bacterium]
METIKKRIIVPTDFSKASLSGIRYALSMAGDCGGEVIVLHIITDQVLRQKLTSPFAYAPEVYYFTDQWRSNLQGLNLEDLVHDKMQRLSDLLDRVLGADLRERVKVTPLIRLGGVVKEIVATAKEEGCDLVVMASRERSRLGSLFTRSLTQQVVRLAPCPVLSIQPSAHVRTQQGKWVPVREMEYGKAA